MADRIKLRRDTEANWTAANPTLSDGEIGFERDSLKLKIGDGSTAWNSLAYVAGVGAFVQKTGDETISGVKTFSSSPIVPSGATGNQVPRAEDTLLKAGNLSGLSSVSEARSNLQLPSAGEEGLRNKLINSCFEVNQRGVSGTVVLAAGAYGHDCWKAGASGCTYTFSTTAGVTTITISAGSLVHVVEGKKLRTGTYVLGWAGTSQGKIDSGSFGASGITASITGGTNATIEFNTGTLSIPQFEPGSVVSPYAAIDSDIELYRCYARAYVESTDAASQVYSCFGYVLNSTNMRLLFKFPTMMRAVPTFTVLAGSPSNFQVVSAGTAFTVTNGPADGSKTQLTAGCDVLVASGLTAGFGGILRAASSTPTRLLWSADL